MSETNEERSARQSESKRAITRDRYDAVLLDLDGVITDTASIHAACWKQMFDEYLQKRATQHGAEKALKAPVHAHRCAEIAPELTAAWDRRFESGFLQRGVKCEPDFRG